MKKTPVSSLSLLVCGLRLLPLVILPVGLQGHGTLGDPIIDLEEFNIQGKAYDLVGLAMTSSTGVANNNELSQRPFQRRGELLEVVPGMIVTQHAGGGKANQYFIRGYNLDHGTDFHVGVDGMPVNFRHHAHGQGYADINFIIPEFTEGLEYFKGPFFAEFGDLSTAGGAEYKFFHELPAGIASFSIGEDGYHRVLLGDTFAMEKGALTIGAEYSHEDGPWLTENDYDRHNVFARYHQGDKVNFFDLTLLYHEGEWLSSDQIPLRGVESGQIDRFGAVDATTGGKTTRQSGQINWRQEDGASVNTLDGWFGFYDLELYSNFTYFLEDPVNGDQFEQNDGRYFGGFNFTRKTEHDFDGRESVSSFGLQTRYDWISDLGLYLTSNRQRLSTVRKDDISSGNFSAFVENETQFSDTFKAGFGLRADYFVFDVDSDNPLNSGDESDQIVSPKLNLVFGPWDQTELYVNAGFGFHSNDARGVTIAVDPNDGVTPADPVDPLVRTKGAEIGIRSSASETTTVTATLWYLESDSELVFVGDGGGTEASDASERWGIELTSYWRPNEWLAVDAEYAYVDAKFVGVAPGFSEIPNSIDHSAAAGVTVDGGEGWFGSMRARYFAPRPLEEGGSVESKDSIILNGRVGYRRDNWEVALDILNLLDRDDNDIEYYYESRLPGEAGGVEDIHFHPVEPRQVRAYALWRF